jgi:hypothetical protein
MKIRHYLLISLLPVLTACGKPEPPSPERPPEPQATAPAASTAQATELRDAIQQPLQQARAVQENSEKVATAQRAAIDAATEPVKQ